MINPVREESSERLVHVAYVHGAVCNNPQDNIPNG
jgi:hypothetical protein